MLQVAKQQKIDLLVEINEDRFVSRKTFFSGEQVPVFKIPAAVFTHGSIL